MIIANRWKIKMVHKDGQWRVEVIDIYIRQKAVKRCVNQEECRAAFAGIGESLLAGRIPEELFWFGLEGENAAREQQRPLSAVA